MKRAYIALLFSTMIVLTACSRDVEVSVAFTESQNVKSGDPVKFNHQVIGEVGGVDEQDQGVTVKLELDPEKIDVLRAGSAAIVMDQPQRHVQIYSVNAGGPLEPGAQIRGLNNAVDLANWSASNALGSLQGMITSAAGAFNQFLNSNDWDAMAKQLNDTLSEMSEQSSEALNQMGVELEMFIKNMQDQSSQTLKQADELSKQLNEQLQKFQSQGKDEIARALQDMLDAFNSTLDPNAVPPSGDRGQPL